MPSYEYVGSLNIDTMATLLVVVASPTSFLTYTTPMTWHGPLSVYG